MSAATDPAQHIRTIFGAARTYLEKAMPREALAALRPLVGMSLDAPTQARLARLAARLAPALPELQPVRVALAAECTVDDLAAQMRWPLLLEGFRLDALILPFGTWQQQLHDPASALYRFKPHAVWIFAGDRALQVDEFRTRPANEAQADVAALQASMAGHAQTLIEQLDAWVIVNNIVPPPWRPLGNLDNSQPGSIGHTVQRYNATLAQALPAGAHVFDLAALAGDWGLARWHDARLWFHSKHPFAFDAHPFVAQAMARFVVACRGRSRKCVAVDLDNTLWGGVIGDDGLEGIVVGPDGGARGEAFAHFQRWLKALSERGVALAACSKNDIATARAAFASRPGMVLQLGDFASFRANWDNKADNLRAIALELNVGLDSFVFVDDNPAERELVRRELPEVAVPEMPEDPADFVDALARGRWFESLNLSDEDRSRTRAYQENAARNATATQATDLPSYLYSLEMRARWGVVSEGSMPRFTQLINKTNQFHPTTTRYSQAQVSMMLADERHWLGWFALADRFGDHGAIASVVLTFEGDTACIDTWAMSCRVFSRTMETFIFSKLVDTARRRGCRRLRATYVPTHKNGVVAGLYESLGGSRVGGEPGGPAQWHFDLIAFEPEGSPYIADANAAPPQSDSTALTGESNAEGTDTIGDTQTGADVPRPLSR